MWRQLWWGKARAAPCCAQLVPASSGQFQLASAQCAATLSSDIQGSSRKMCLKKRAMKKVWGTDLEQPGHRRDKEGGASQLQKALGFQQPSASAVGFLTPVTAGEAEECKPSPYFSKYTGGDVFFSFKSCQNINKNRNSAFKLVKIQSFKDSQIHKS